MITIFVVLPRFKALRMAGIMPTSAKDASAKIMPMTEKDLESV